jgi:chromosome segregation ATPase
MVNFLETKGEFTPEDLVELQAMTQPELVAFAIGLSKGWYQLLESLEQAHRQDLEQLQTRLEAHFQEGLRTTTASHTAQLTDLKTQLSSLEKSLAGGLAREKDTSEMLKKLKSTLTRLTSDSAAKK